VLHNLAKDMGVLVEDTDFASFDMLKELETARNCLHLKQINQSKPNSCVEFVPCEDHIINMLVLMRILISVRCCFNNQKKKASLVERRDLVSPQGEEPRPRRSWLASF
jgi:hypothetical protein